MIRRRRQHCIEERSYLPELFYAYGHPLVARDELMEQLEPGYARREYPEVSYAAIGSIVAGMLGIAPDAHTQTVSTCSRLTDDVAWVQLTSLPCLANVIDVRHDGQARTIFTNRSGPTLHWQAVFPGHHAAPAARRRSAPPAPGCGCQWPAAERAQGGGSCQHHPRCQRAVDKNVPGATSVAEPGVVGRGIFRPYIGWPSGNRLATNPASTAISGSTTPTASGSSMQRKVRPPSSFVTNRTAL